MIRINLLPIGKRPVEEKIRKEITVFFLLMFFSLSVMVYFHIDHTHRIKQITAEKKTVDSEIRRYQDRQRQLQELQEKHKMLEQKLGVIEQLKKNRDLQVRVLDQLAIIVPTDQMWIKTLDQRGNTLTLTGVARGNEVIAQFMKALEKSPYIDANGVVLKQSRQVKIQGYKLKNFNLTATVIVPAPAKEGPQKKGEKQKAKTSSGGAA
jgi:type IV pilus assembly protein PilN